MAADDLVLIRDYRCLRCGCETFSKGEARVATSFLGRLFNVEAGRFITASCNRCGFTDFYKRSSSTLGNILDFLGN
jgi:predicted nucleic-acid-binding Zn-ribbon protein